MGALPFARHAEVKIALDELFGEHEDLAGVQLDVADDLKDRFEGGEVAPGAVGLGVDDGEEIVSRERAEDVAHLFERGVEAGVGFRGQGGGRDGELFVAVADIGLAGDAVEHPLAHVAFEVQQQVGHGVFVVAAAVPHLLFGKLGDTFGDLALG